MHHANHVPFLDVVRSVNIQRSASEDKRAHDVLVLRLDEPESAYNEYKSLKRTIETTHKSLCILGAPASSLATNRVPTQTP